MGFHSFIRSGGMVFFLLSLALTAHAGPAEDQVREQVSLLNRLNGRGCPRGRPCDRGLAIPEACQRRYAQLNGDGVLTIHIGFGHYDNIGSGIADRVTDQYNRMALEAQLTSPCISRHLGICGFRRTNNPNVFNKSDMWEGAPRRIILQIQHGSYSTFLSQNTGVYRQQQDERCAAVTQGFMNRVGAGLDVNFYVGHSRDGGGPDFCPVELKPNGRVNYEWYQRERREGRGGHVELVRALTRGVQRNPHLVLGLFSCASRQHFMADLREVAPQAGLLFNNGLPEADENFRSMIGALDSLLVGRCGAEFDEAARGGGDTFEAHGLFVP